MEDEKKLAQEDVTPVEEAAEATEAAVSAENVAEATEDVTPAEEAAEDTEAAVPAEEAQAPTEVDASPEATAAEEADAVPVEAEEVNASPKPEKKKKKSKKKIIIPIVLAVVAILLIGAILFTAVAVVVLGATGLGLIGVGVGFYHLVDNLTLNPTYTELALSDLMWYDEDGDGIKERLAHNAYAVSDHNNGSIPSYLFIPKLYRGAPVVGISDSAFYGCDVLTGIDLPHTVGYIGSDAFRACSSLETVSFGTEVTSIGSYAFAYCPDLAINYAGTCAQFESIQKGYGWAWDTYITVYCTDGTVIINSTGPELSPDYFD